MNSTCCHSALEKAAFLRSIQQFGRALIVGCTIAAPASRAGELPVQVLEQLAADATAAVDHFQPVGAEALDAAAANLREAMRPLRELLARSDSEAGWKAFLDWETLEAQAADGAAADPTALRRIESLFGEAQTGLEMPEFVRVRRAVERYAEAADAAKGAGAEFAASRLKKLAANLRAAAANGTLASLESTGPTLVRMADAGQAPEVIHGVRQALGRPNLFLEVHERLFTQAVDRPVDETDPIRDCILGSSVRGIGHTQGFVRADIVPSANCAAFDLVLDARNHSKTCGTKGPVTAHSLGHTDLGARRRIFLDDEQVSAAPVQAAASTSTCLTGIDVHLPVGKRIVTRIAERKIAEMTPEIEAIAGGKARARIRREFTTQTDPGIKKFRAEFQDRVRKPLETWSMYPERIAVHSTDAALMATTRKASPVQLAAANAPPATAAENVLAARVHESAINNALEQEFGGTIFSERDAEKMATDFKTEMPEALDSKKKKQKSWEITFSEHRPITVRAADGRLTFMVRGDKFVTIEQPEGGGEVVRTAYPAMDISATYEIRRGPRGFVLVRDGDVGIFPPGFQRGVDTFDAEETAVRGVLRPRFERLFKEEIDVKDLQLKGELAKAGPLPMHQFEAYDDGWIVVGWRAKDPGATAAPQPVAAGPAAEILSLLATLMMQ